MRIVIYVRLILVLIIMILTIRLIYNFHMRKIDIYNVKVLLIAL